MISLRPALSNRVMTTSRSLNRKVFNGVPLTNTVAETGPFQPLYLGLPLRT